MVYRVSVTIEVNNAYCLRKYENRKPEFVSDRLRELNDDKTGWSSRIFDYAQQVIAGEGMPFKRMPFRKYFSTTKTITNFEISKSAGYDEIALAVRKRVNMSNSSDPNQVSGTNEVYLSLIDEYSSLDDIQLAHLIVLLSRIAERGDELWASVVLRIKELNDTEFYFLPSGKIALSAKSARNANSAITSYIDRMNGVIDGSVRIPR